jgi:PPK2 family polyphosphate:nucleotide phosphotransferase
MKFTHQFQVKPGRSVRLKDYRPDETGSFTKEEAEKTLNRNSELLFDLQHRLFAEDKRAVLIILQGMDTSGKDGVIRNVLRGFNPQGCTVTPFKAPSSLELNHDFLWRIHKAIPERGDIGVFNRSHYEDVLIARVKKLVTKEVWKQRYKQINDFERMLVENGVTVLKFFLYISKEEQKERLEDRLKDPAKNWKFNEGDLVERKLWDKYVEAYEDALSECSTSCAPWYVIPANKKWFRNLAISEILTRALQEMDPQLPKPLIDISKIKIR